MGVRLFSFGGVWFYVSLCGWSWFWGGFTFLISIVVGDVYVVVLFFRNVFFYFVWSGVGIGFFEINAVLVKIFIFFEGGVWREIVCSNYFCLCFCVVVIWKWSFLKKFLEMFMFRLRVFLLFFRFLVCGCFCGKIVEFG